jgi:hypothetical protein
MPRKLAGFSKEIITSILKVKNYGQGSNQLESRYHAVLGCYFDPEDGVALFFRNSDSLSGGRTD